MLSEEPEKHLPWQIDICRITGGETLKITHKLLAEEYEKRRALLPPVTEHVVLQIDPSLETISQSNVFTQRAGISSIGKPTHIEYEPLDRGTPHIPQPISLWKAPNRLNVLRVTTKAGFWAGVEGLYTNAEAVKVACGFGIVDP